MSKCFSRELESTFNETVDGQSGGLDRLLEQHARAGPCDSVSALNVSHGSHSEIVFFCNDIKPTPFVKPTLQCVEHPLVTKKCRWAGILTSTRPMNIRDHRISIALRECTRTLSWLPPRLNIFEVYVTRHFLDTCRCCRTVPPYHVHQAIYIYLPGRL